jgi:hypothetical protein
MKLIMKKDNNGDYKTTLFVLVVLLFFSCKNDASQPVQQPIGRTTFSGSIKIDAATYDMTVLSAAKIGDSILISASANKVAGFIFYLKKNTTTGKIDFSQISTFSAFDTKISPKFAYYNFYIPSCEMNKKFCDGTMEITKFSYGSSSLFPDAIEGKFEGGLANFIEMPYQCANGQFGPIQPKVASVSGNFSWIVK